MISKSVLSPDGVSRMRTCLSSDGSSALNWSSSSGRSMTLALLATQRRERTGCYGARRRSERIFKQSRLEAADWLARNRLLQTGNRVADLDAWEQRERVLLECERRRFLLPDRRRLRSITHQGVCG